MFYSIMTDKTDQCLFCMSMDVEEHHIFFGTSNRAKSERHKLKVPLCGLHHRNGKDSPHKNRIIDLALKCWGQAVYEEKIGDRDDFRREFGKSYL